MALSIQVHRSIEEIPKDAWNRLTPPDEPFLEHGFLWALEKSESVGTCAGWMPFYLSVREGGEVLGAAPAYLKDHSYGEYVFDWAWADAYRRHGQSYYPKLVCAAPMTPTTGKRLLCAPGKEGEVRTALAQGLVTLAKETRATGLHLLFVHPEEAPVLEAMGFLIRYGCQFHWRNEGYSGFDEFLERLTQKRRKEARRERRQAAEHGLGFCVVAGAEAAGRMKAMNRFYRDTVNKRGGYPYLTKAFFDLLPEAVPESLRLFLALDGDEPVAGTLCFEKGAHLYGRYWGADRDLPALHFETCYYQGIEYAIQRELQLFEAGAQGEHKLARGFLPQLTYSAHVLLDPGFHEAIEEFLGRERRRVLENLAHYKEHSPFKSLNAV